MNPATTPVSGSAPIAVTVTVSTTTRSATAPSLHGQYRPGRGALLALSMFGFPLACCWIAGKLRHARGVLMMAMVVLAIMLAGCGGGGSAGSPPPAQTGTPAGTYTLTVAATSGSVTHNMSLTVTVN